ncbi:MAG: SPASM domain-containing protein [Deltaproteobacteria bacterium]|nr:SPASM domain-containing protein [Deltaproteobacteria bacterium]
MFEFTKGKALPNYGLIGVNRKFRRLNLEMTASCHNRCAFCFVDMPTRKGTMSMDDLQHALVAIPNFSGSCYVCLHGESFLLNDLPERCGLVKRHWPDCELALTTTFNIDRGTEYIERLFASGLQSLNISCYGYTMDGYKKLHGINAFSAVLNNMRYLKNIKNIDKKLINLCSFTNIKDKFDIDEDKAKKEFMRFAKECGIKTVNEAPMRLWNEPDDISAPKRRMPYVCPVVWGPTAEVLHIAFNLDVYPCCSLVGNKYGDGPVIGNLRRNTLEEIFNSPAYLHFYDKHWARELDGIPWCSNCGYIHNTTAPDELARLAAYEGNRLAGQKVYYWGGGETFRKYGLFFSGTNPQAVLVDIEGEHPSHVHGIPVTHPDVALNEKNKLPIIIFAAPRHNNIIIESIIRKYPYYTYKDIVLAHADMWPQRSVQKSINEYLC